MRRLLVVAVVVAAGSVAATAGASRGTFIGKTPRAAAFGEAQQWGAHEIAANYGNRYSDTFGTCVRMFQHPWVAWGCFYELDDVHWHVFHQCDLAVSSVKWLDDGTYRATFERLQQPNALSEENRTPCSTSLADYAYPKAPDMVMAVVTGFEPSAAKGGAKVRVIGSGFQYTTKVTVGGVSATYTVGGDQNMVLVVPKTAPNGKDTVAITKKAGVTTSTIMLVKKG